MSVRILVVEDESPMRRFLAELLEKAGHSVFAVGSAEEAMREFHKNPPELILLDVSLPEMDGFEFCRQIRAIPEGKDTLVIFLTSQDQEVNKVVGLELGADDYMTKPFSSAELLARVKSVFRRRKPVEEDSLKGGALTVDVPARSVRIGRKTVEVTGKGFDILCALLRKKGKVLSRPYLMGAIWGSDYSETTRTVDTHVYRLRKELGRHGSCITAVGGMGYKWEDL